MAKREGPSTSSPSARKEVERDEREIGNTRRLDKLPQEMWEKIIDNLEENDLFPLALSCRYFRQKPKELVARTRQSGPGSGKPHRALKTTLHEWPVKDQPASAEYLRFCSKEKASKEIPNCNIDVEQEEKALCIRVLAALHGYLPLLQELLEPANELDRHITDNAARGGQLETLQWLKTQEGFKLDTKLFVKACEGGHLEIIRWLRSEGCPWGVYTVEYPSAWGAPANSGHLETLKWLRSEGCPWDAWTCTYAAEGGDLETLKWLRSEGCPWDEDACTCAAKGGHLEVLKWLRSEGCPWGEGACTYAAKGGHLEMLKWLRSEGCPWDKYACAGAAQGGHLETLKWLRSEGCPLDDAWTWTCTCTYAAKGGHLEVLKWLRSEGCPWDKNTCSYAAEGGHLDVLEWAIDNGCPYEVNGRTRPALESLGLA